MLPTLLTFGIPAVLSHFGVSLALPALAGVIGTKAAATVGGKVVGTAAARGVGALLKHIANGGEVTHEHRTWAAQHQDVFTVPKQQPGQQPGPDVWTIQKQ